MTWMRLALFCLTSQFHDSPTKQCKKCSCKSSHPLRLFLKIIVGLRTDSFHFEGNKYSIVFFFFFFFFLNYIFKNLFAIASVGKACSCDSVVYTLAYDSTTFSYIIIWPCWLSFNLSIFHFSRLFLVCFFYQ